MRARTLATISIGLLAAACQAPYNQNTRTANMPAGGSSYQASTAACSDYGFRPGTASFNQCVAGEQQARAAGRVNRDYTPVQLTVDARNACNSYGLTAGTASWDRCVNREVEARSYRVDTATPGGTYYTDQYGYQVDSQGYRVDANGVRMAGPAPYTQSGPQAYPVQPASTYRVDQYGNRVDAEGYRVDSNGRRMAVQGPYYSQESAPSVAAATRDEFGNRYDGYGNRLDAGGRVVAMPASR